MDIFDISLYVGYILVVVGALAAILLPLISSVGNPGGMLKSGLAVAGLAVIFAIAYFISDSDVAAKFAEEPFNLTPGTSQFVGGLLISSYFLFIIAFVGIFITEITKMVR